MKKSHVSFALLSLMLAHPALADGRSPDAGRATRPGGPLSPDLIEQACQLDADSITTDLVEHFELDALIDAAQAKAKAMTDDQRAEADTYLKLINSSDSVAQANGQLGLNRLNRTVGLNSEMSTNAAALSHATPVDGHPGEFYVTGLGLGVDQGKLTFSAARMLVRETADHHREVVRIVTVNLPDLTGEGRPTADSVTVMDVLEARQTIASHSLPEYVVGQLPSFCQPAPAEQAPAPRPAQSTPRGSRPGDYPAPADTGRIPAGARPASSISDSDSSPVVVAIADGGTDGGGSSVSAGK